ncbi:MAG: hypothetical protein RSF37_09875 [Clostridium sp.]|uniref:hypothetical protein n=1 Tax=Clostridium sp. TaxID=1506 RepID=UPI002FC6C781
MKNKKIIALTVVGIIGITTLIGCKSGEIKRQLESGITALNAGKYDEAKEDFEEVIREDGNNIEAQDLVTIISNYEDAKKEFEKNNIDGAKDYLSKIPEAYNKYSIKDDIDKLKDEVDKKDKIIKDIDAKLQNIDSLIKDKKYAEAQNEANKIDTKDGLKEQEDKLNNYKKIINERLEEIKKKEAEEKVKREREETAAKKAVEEKKSAENKKAAENKKNQNKVQESTKNINYTNKQLGLQMEIPASWKGRYKVDTYKDGSGMTFCFVADNGEIGTLLFVQKDDGMHSMFDDTVYKTINGVKYIMGGTTDVGMNPNNSQYDLYKKLRRQANIITETIRAAK